MSPSVSDSRTLLSPWDAWTFYMHDSIRMMDMTEDKYGGMKGEYYAVRNSRLPSLFND